MILVVMHSDVIDNIAQVGFATWASLWTILGTFTGNAVTEDLSKAMLILSP